jgi:phage gp36-like protein
MANITYDDIVPSRMSESLLRDLTDGTDTVDMEVVNDLIDRASSFVNSYCVGLYSNKMPWNPVPDMIKELTLDIFEFRTNSRGPRNPDQSVVDTFNAARSTLEKISMGKIKFLEPDTGVPVPENSIQHTNKTKADMKFHSDNIPGYFRT